MNVQEIRAIQQRIVECDLAVKALVQNVWQCDSNFDDLQDINVEIAKQIGKHKAAIDELEQIGWSLTKTAARDAINSELDGYRSQLEANYNALRKANNASRSNIEQRSKNDLLSLNTIEPDSDTMKLKRRHLAKDQLARKTKNVTEDLLSISRMMANQVQLSESTLGSLVKSSETVTETGEEFKLQSSLLQQSRKLLGKYGRREITDKVFIFLALAFFFGAVLYVVLKRLF